jgi:hypothetical protein
VKDITDETDMQEKHQFVQLHKQNKYKNLVLQLFFIFLKLAWFQSALVPARLRELQKRGGRGRNASAGTASACLYYQEEGTVGANYILTLEGIKKKK